MMTDLLREQPEVVGDQLVGFSEHGVEGLFHSIFHQIKLTKIVTDCETHPF